MISGTQQAALAGLLTSLSMFAGAGTPQAETTPHLAALLPADWELRESHSDEFDDSGLDLRKWETDLPDWGSWSWRNDHVRVADGVLRIWMAFDPHDRQGRQLSYTAGIVRSREAPLRYGYFEARIRAAARWPGLASAFWLFRNRPEYWTEIDIVELMQRRNSRNIVDFSLYVLRDPRLAELPVRRKEHVSVSWDPSQDFHVYGCMWEPHRIRHFVDGRLVGEIANDHWDRPMDVVLSLGLREPLVTSPERGGFPSAMEVDYIRVWGPADQQLAAANVRGVSSAAVHGPAATVHGEPRSLRRGAR